MKDVLMRLYEPELKLIYEMTKKHEKENGTSIHTKNLKKYLKKKLNEIEEEPTSK